MWAKVGVKATLNAMPRLLPQGAVVRQRLFGWACLRAMYTLQT